MNKLVDPASLVLRCVHYNCHASPTRVLLGVQSSLPNGVEYMCFFCDEHASGHATRHWELSDALRLLQDARSKMMLNAIYRGTS